MDKLHYKEMVSCLDEMIRTGIIRNKRIYLFGHCNATEELADLLLNRGFFVEAILDNNEAKQGNHYRKIRIVSPRLIQEEEHQENMLVCIAARAYAAMADQLKRLGYTGQVQKLVDYNTYAEYSFSSDTMLRKYQRTERGICFLRQLKEKYPGHFIFLCPFSALGDIYFTMSYLPYFICKRKITDCMIAVIGAACGQVVRLFGNYSVEILDQKTMDETVQAALYFDEPSIFIPHQDRPYTINLSKALYIKCIPLEKIYCCGIFGLPPSTKPFSPVCLKPYGGIKEMKKGRSVIFSPYAKSVTALGPEIWGQIIKDYQDRGYDCYTNIAGDEKPLPDTRFISPSILEIQSAVEWAGTFIGIRSGLCDVIREASCRKIALYPDYLYCDTKWKAIDMYRLDGWENIVIGEDFQWKNV